MGIVPILFIAIGLSMDAFAVSIASGLKIKHLEMNHVINHALTMAVAFGGFQALMPLLGWSAGFSLRKYIMDYDHWIAFGLLSIVGCKMIYESFQIESEEQTKSSLNNTEYKRMNYYLLLTLSIATSIDAMAIGLSLSFLNISVVTPAIIIGIITFLISFLGVLIGKKFGHIFESKIEIIGGLILIGIGLKILIDHLSV